MNADLYVGQVRQVTGEYLYSWDHMGNTYTLIRPDNKFIVYKKCVGRIWCIIFANTTKRYVKESDLFKSTMAI